MSIENQICRYYGSDLKELIRSFNSSKIGTVLILMALAPISYAFGQTYDRSKEPIFDPYSAPNIHVEIGRNFYDYYGSGDVNNDESINLEDAQLIRNGQVTAEMKDRADVNGDQLINNLDAGLIENYINGITNYLPGHWDELNLQENRRDLKLDWLNKMLAIDKTDENTYSLNYYDCTQFTKQTIINFMGLKDFEDYYEYDLYNSYGYTATNARFNIPVEHLWTDVTNSNENHESCIVFIGQNGNILGDSSLDFLESYIIFEPQDDQERHIGDINYDPNGVAYIKGLNYDEETQNHGLANLIKYKLTNGVPEIEEGITPGGDTIQLIAPDMIRENPFFIDIDTSFDDEKSTGMTVVNYSVPLDESEFPDAFVETNSEYYADKIETKEWYSDTIPLNGEYPWLEFEFTKNATSHLELGRHYISSDTAKHTIQVYDLEKPVLNVPEDVTLTKTENDFELTLDETGYASATDNSGLEPEITQEYFLVSEEGLTKYYQSVFTATDVVGNQTTRIQNVTVDIATPIEEVSDLEKMIAYPNPTTGKVNFNYTKDFGKVNYEIYDMGGRIVDYGINTYWKGDRIELNLEGSPGMYIIQLFTTSWLEQHKVYKK